MHEAAMHEAVMHENMADERAQPTRRPTIIDVAEHAGVSKSLASRALRGDPGVSERRRALVVDSATELGYRTNSAARSLVRGTSGLIGVVLNEIGNQHHTAVVAGVEAHAAAVSSSVIIGHGGNDVSTLCRQMDTMIELRVDGLVIVSSWVPCEVLARVGREVPIVVVSRLDNPPPDIDTICSDDFAGAVMAAEHLAALGRRRIAYMTRSSSATSKARARGMRSGAAAAGIDCRVYELGRSADGLRDAVRRHDGILCNNDPTAAEVAGLARDEGIDIPGQLALVGYDDTALAQLVHPRLSSVGQPQYRMGLRAGAAVSERLSGRTEPLRELYAPTLVIRSSAPEVQKP